MTEELRRSCSRKEEEIEKLDCVNRELRDKLRGLSEEITSKNQSLKSLHGQFVEIDEDIKRFRAEFSEKEGKVRELEEKLRLRESQLEEVRLRLTQRDEQEKINMKSVRSVKKLPRRERFSLDQSESSLSVLQRPLVRRDRRALQEKEREERGDIEKDQQPGGQRHHQESQYRGRVRHSPTLPGNSFSPHLRPRLPAPDTWPSLLLYWACPQSESYESILSCTSHHHIKEDVHDDVCQP